jgi:hypothetical protein
LTTSTTAAVATRGRLLPFVYYALIRPLRNLIGAGAAALAGRYWRWRERVLHEECMMRERLRRRPVETWTTSRLRAG